MGSICSKLCGDKKEAYKEKKQEDDLNINNTHVAQPVDKDSNVKILTNQGGTIDTSPDKLSEPDVSRDDETIGRNLASNKGFDSIQNKPNVKEEEKKEDGRKERKKKVKEEDSDTTSSDSDKTYHRRKKKKRRDNFTVYKSVKIGGSVNKYYGNNITINNKKTVSTANLPAGNKTDTLFSCMHDKKSADLFRTEIFPHNDSGGCFIDLNPIGLAEDASVRLAIDRMLGSVGIVTSPRGKFTCFRVGPKYVMTALHGIEMIVKPEVDDVHNAHLAWDDRLHVLSGEGTYIDFEYLDDREHRHSNKFFFKDVTKDSIPFYDPATDCIVLELEEVSGRSFPPPFKEFGFPNLKSKFTLIHHAGGKTKKVEPVSRIINMDAQQSKNDSLKLSRLSQEFLTENGLDVSYYQCELPPYNILMNRNRILFHCQCNKGSSGAPGLQVTSDGKVTVVTMMLHGYPDWYYSSELDHIIRYWNEADTVEQGANLHSIYAAIRDKNVRLFNDIFMIGLSRTVQPVQPKE
ncbi:hypothetical protein ACF0H5_021303 [Mactra antiquata]